MILKTKEFDLCHPAPEITAKKPVFSAMNLVVHLCH